MDPESGGLYRLKNKATGHVLTARTDLDDVSVYTLRQSSVVADMQRWKLELTTDRHWHLNHPQSGRRLDSNTERSIYILGANDGSFQKWLLRPDVEDYWTLQNLATGFMVDSNADGHAYTMPMNDGAYQRWRFLAHPW
jgi:Ricin-type beta-trefoil lectin domain-like